MWIPEDARQPLNNESNLDAIDASIRQFGTLPSEALILDEDLPVMPLLRELRNQQLRFNGGRGALGRYKRVEVAHAAHLFETTQDKKLLEWCNRHGYILLTCNVKDFEKLDRHMNHSGMIVSRDQGYPASKPSDFARKCNQIFNDWRKHNFWDTIFTIRP